MIRKLLILWLGPIVFFWSWYYLSLNDIGFIFYSRQVHDQVFTMYGTLLGVDPDSIAPMVAKSLVFDSLLLFAIIGFRQRKVIASTLRRYGKSRGHSMRSLSDDSLSNAP